VRASFILRLATVVVLVAIVGLPGLAGFDPTSAEARTSIQGMPAGNAWTGVLAAPAEAQADDDDPSEPAESLIVRFRPRAAHANQVSAHQEAGARGANAIALSDTVRVEVKKGRRDSALAAYSARPDVLYAEPDYTVYALYTPNDPRFPNQWGPQKVGAQAAWDVTRGSSTVRVAIVDCGVFSQATGRLAGDGQAGHPDLRGRVGLNQDFTGSSTGFDDYCNHGTHVAGIVGAAGNNGVGISGLAPQVTLMNAKVLGDSGSGSTSNILNGVVWAVQNGAKVINMSLGRDGACSQSERDTMNWAWSQGVVVVAAAGNSNLGSSGSPANCDNVISVASTTSTDARSSFSNYGTGVDVAAPGSSIISTVRTGDYSSFNGTSMASPHVAALTGLLWSQNPSATAQAVVDRIRTTSDPIAGTGSFWTWGRINAAAAVNGWGSGPPTPTVTATATNTPVTPTSTPTQIPVPIRVPCPSPRPPVQIATAATGAGTLDVTVTAGAGVIREIDFRSLRNAAVTIDSQSGVTSPFVYRPTSYSRQVPFTVTQQSGSQATTVSLAILDDCGTWTTFVGGGTNGFRPPSGSTQEIAVALTWGASPADLDVHLSGPSTGGGRFHTYWNNANVVSHATISADDHDGFGPETVTIRRSTQTSNWVPGEYRIWAHNYSGTPGYSGSTAKVTVTRGGQQLGAYEVANASGSSALTLWRSVNLTVDASGNVSLAPVQQFVSGGSTTVLRIEDGSNGELQWPATGKR
jgi:thermitase